MTLSAGTRLGPYEIVSPLGAGGMGEVYRAKDARLGREVAIKVLPAALASDAERLKRFEKEAKSASALNHPNIVTVYDIGSADGTSYIAMELVSGETLRTFVASGALPVKKLLSIAVQVAEGLAKAHEAGIVHRDLKPENLMVTKDGLVKILDFGLAKLTSTMSGSGEGSNLPTMTGTTPGVVVGTVGYMSPEQASGATVDFRSDQFALGSILYEMATGRRAFQKKTAVDTLAAILNQEPEAIASISPQAPAPLRWIVERCLTKEPDGRYVSTRDLARELRSVQAHLSEASLGSLPLAHRSARGWPVGLTAGVAGLVLLGLAFLLGRQTAKAPPLPSFQRLTFRRGFVSSARFSSDATVIYSARWDGNPLHLYSTRPGSPESTQLDLPDASLLSISSAGELAIALHPNPADWGFEGTLARVALAGGAPREVQEKTRWSDWAPDGKTLLTVRNVDGRNRLEFPVGHSLLEVTGGGWIGFPRISPKGDRVAFIEYASPGDDAGSVAVVDVSGRKTTLSRGWFSAQGLAWSPRADEVWFTASKQTFENREIRAVRPSGKERLVFRAPLGMILQDIASDGRALVIRQSWRTTIHGLGPGDSRERDLSWNDFSMGAALSRDGETLLMDEQGSGSGTHNAVGIRRMDGSPAVRLGDGGSWDLSPDGKWALTTLMNQHPAQLFLTPTGPGETTPLTHDEFDHQQGQFFPDGKHFLFNGRAPGRRVRPYVQEIGGGAPRPIAEEGVEAHWKGISPDGKFVMGSSATGWSIYPVDGGAPRPIAGLEKGGPEEPIGWTDDTNVIFVRAIGGKAPLKVNELNLSTGKRTLWKEVGTAEAGNNISGLLITPNGNAYAYSSGITPGDLFLVEGLR